jgi:hypothetical protein
MLALGRSYVALKTSVKLRKLGLRASVDENRPHPKDVASSANITASIHAAISVHNATGISGIY